MAKNNLYGDFKKKLDRIQNHMAEEVAPQVNELLKESVRYSLIDWYNDYEPNMYKRTYNFMKILDSTRTSGKGNILTLSVDSSAMNPYQGFDEPPYEGYEKQPLNTGTAFDYMFINGEHGHGRWMMHRSIPPYMYVDRDIMTGWNGRLDKLVNDRVEEILGK